MSNPFAKITKEDEKAGKRRKRRALMADELVRLLDAAKRRPLIKFMMIRRGKNKGNLSATVSISVRERLEQLGRERALI